MKLFKTTTILLVVHYLYSTSLKYTLCKCLHHLSLCTHSCTLLSSCPIHIINDTDAYVHPQWNYIMCKTELLQEDSDPLNRSHNLDELDETLWNDKCDFIDMEMCNNPNPNNYNLLVLQLNIRSVLAHQHELKQLLRVLEKKNSRIDAVLLCETFLTKNTVKKSYWEVCIDHLIPK